MTEMTETTTARPMFLGQGRQPGVNVDHIDVEAGIRALRDLGWSPDQDGPTFMVITYALQRWARGEEGAAERLAIGQGETDPRFVEAAIDLTSWRVVLAHAISSAEAKAAEEARRGALYCPRCRTYFANPGPAHPPYAATHKDDEHVHPISGRELAALPEG